MIEVDEADASSGSLSSGSYTCYGYDLNDNLTSAYTPNGTTRTFAYDKLSRVTSVTNDPESGTTSYIYDSGSSGTNCGTSYSFPGQLISITDARSKVTCFTYDALGRVTQVNHSDSTPAVTYSYDSTDCLGLGSCSNVGRRTGMTDGSGSTAWAYDEVGNIRKETRTISGITKSIEYTYNKDSSVATVKYPSGRTITYAPGGAQRPLSVKDVANSVDYAKGPASPYNISYASHGALRSHPEWPESGFHVLLWQPPSAVPNFREEQWNRAHIVHRFRQHRQRDGLYLRFRIIQQRQRIGDHQQRRYQSFADFHVRCAESGQSGKDHFHLFHQPDEVLGELIHCRRFRQPHGDWCGFVLLQRLRTGQSEHYREHNDQSDYHQRL